MIFFLIATKNKAQYFNKLYFAHTTISVQRAHNDEAYSKANQKIPARVTHLLFCIHVPLIRPSILSINSFNYLQQDFNFLLIFHVAGKANKNFFNAASYSVLYKRDVTQEETPSYVRSLLKVFYIKDVIKTSQSL